MHAEDTCWELLDLARRGQESAQRALVAKYRPPVEAYFRRRGVEANEAEDLAQSVLVRLFSGALDRADPRKGSFRGLLGTIAYRVLASHLRARGAAKRGDGAAPADLDDLEVAGERPEREFDREWFARLLELALSRLAEEHPTYYQAIDACLVQERPQDEVAAALGCSLQDVRNRLFRGRRKLHAYLTEQIAVYAPEPDQHATEVGYLGALLGPLAGD